MPLIHARYVLIIAGLNSVLQKYYKAREYGRCLRVPCKDQPVLPAAVSDLPPEEAVKVNLCRSASASCPPPLAYLVASHCPGFTYWRLGLTARGPWPGRAAEPAGSTAR
jgi:hypothetical protein